MVYLHAINQLCMCQHLSVNNSVFGNDYGRLSVINDIETDFFFELKN